MARQATPFSGEVFIDRRHPDGVEKFFAMVQYGAGRFWYGDLRDTSDEALTDARSHLDGIGCTHPVTHGR